MILQDLVNTGEVRSFINNIIIEMEEQEEHDMVVEKVVKRLVENNDMLNQKNTSKQSIRLANSERS